MKPKGTLNVATPAMREIIRQRIAEGRSMREIAAEIGRCEQAVNAHRWAMGLPSPERVRKLARASR